MPQIESDDDGYEYRWKRRSAAIHRVQLSVLYHHKRERFFDSIDRVVTTLSLVFATAATAAILKKSGTAGGTQIEWELWMSLVAAVAGCIAVGFTPGIKAKLHGQLAADMRRLWARFEKAGEDWSFEQCDEFTSDLINVEAGEAAQLGALVTQCENEIAVAAGNLENVRELTLRMSLFKHWWNFDTTGLKRLTESQIREMRSRSVSKSRPE